MIAFHPTYEDQDHSDFNVRGIIQQQVREIVASLPRSTLRSGRTGPAMIRLLAVGEERFRLVVDLLPPADGADPVPVASVERLAADDVNERALRERYRLTHKETHVAMLLAQRRSNAEIAEALKISPHTARRHTENVMMKLNVNSRFSVETALRAVA